MLKGEKYVGEKVDVWSLGIILYVFFCGELLFDDDDDNVMCICIIFEEFKYFDYLFLDVVVLIKFFLLKCFFL